MAEKPHRSRIVDITAFRWQGEPPRAWPEWARNDLRLRWENTNIQVDTNQGTVRANIGDWIILGEEDVYPCSDSVFRTKYDPI